MKVCKRMISIAAIFSMCLPGMFFASDKKLTVISEGPMAIDKAHLEKAAGMMNMGISWLLDHRDEKGVWSGKNGAFRPALTGLVLKGLLQHPDFTSESEVVKNGFKVLLGYQQEDGGVYNPREGRSNYCTSIAVCALAEANDPKYKAAMEKAVKFLRDIQIKPGSKSRDPKKEGETIGEDHPYVGGVSYGAKHGRPDLNNLGWWMEAMYEAGVEAEDPAMQRALAFVNRCQNRSESNPMAWAKTDDGGFIYAPARRDVTEAESKAGEAPGGGLQSYGSISYTAWKSMLYAGVSRDDPRIKSLYAWVRKHWTLTQNPNMPEERNQQGLYFYYVVFARALRGWQIDEVPDIDKDKPAHNWRHELIDVLAEKINDDGSWSNKADRWMEGDPTLVTAYEILALAEVLGR